MADDLFTLQAVIVEERLIRHHVAVLAGDHHDHFMKSVDGMAISLQPGFSQLAAGDVLDDAYAHWGRGSAASWNCGSLPAQRSATRAAQAGRSSSQIMSMYDVARSSSSESRTISR